MFFTYIYRELRRRHRQALLTALGLAVGVGLVVAVTAYAQGVSTAQSTVLHSLYGVGTDITVSQTAKLDQGGPPRFDMSPGSRQQGKAFSRDAVRSAPGQQSLAATEVTQIAALDGVAQAVGGLTLNSIHISGNFAQAFSQGGGQTRRLRRRGSAARALRLAGAHQGVVVLDRRRRRRPDRAGAPELHRARRGAHVQHVGGHHQGRRPRQVLRQAERLRGRLHVQDLGRQVPGDRAGDLGGGQRLGRQRVHPADARAEAERQRRQGQPDLRQSRERQRDRQGQERDQGACCPRRP